jgi:hypothetical protein
MPKTSQTAATVLLLAGAARAELPTAVNLHEQAATNLNLLSIFCDPVADSKGNVSTDEARCTFVQAMVRKPSKEDISKELRQLDDPKLQVELKRTIKAQCAQLPLEPPRAMHDTERRFFDLYKAACASQSAGALMDALKYSVRELKANTCEVTATGGKTFRFKRLHDNAWQALDAGLGGTVVMTIWREASKPWNYRESRAGDTTCNPAKDALCRGPSQSEFVWGPAPPSMNCPLLTK